MTPNTTFNPNRCLCEYKNLANLLDSADKIVLKGIEKGGYLNNESNEYVLNKSTPCTDSFENLFTEDFTTPAFITLEKDKVKGSGYWFFQLDEYYSSDNQWNRRIGIGNLITGNELRINEIDAECSIVFENDSKEKNKIKMLRQRTYTIGKHDPFIQAADLFLSSIGERNKYIPCKKNKPNISKKNKNQEIEKKKL